MNEKSSILIVEDDPALLQGLLDVLVFNGFSPKGISDGSAGLNEILQIDYDLLILDVMLPGMDGFEICQKVRNAKPQQPILMLTAKGSEADIVHGFDMGADDYVCKPFSLNELMGRVKALLRRSGRSRSARQFLVGGIEFDAGALTGVYLENRCSLTRREMDIVEYLFDHKDRIVSRNELLKEVWKYADADVETRTVDIHMLKLRKKIAELCDGFDPSKGGEYLISTVRGEGYRIAVRQP